MTLKLALMIAACLFLVADIGVIVGCIVCATRLLKEWKLAWENGRTPPNPEYVLLVRRGFSLLIAGAFALALGLAVTPILL